LSAVKKVSKAILIGLAVLVALVVALLVGLNLYIQSPGAQARIQEELSKSLRLPLKITNTSVSPWSDLRITGISIPNGDANFLEATSFTARYRLLPLLQGKLVIPEMQVESPKVLWIQTAEGKWKLPEPEQAAAISREEGPASATPAPPAQEESKTAKEEKKAGKKKSDFVVQVDRFDVKDGTFELLDKDRKPAATFRGVNMTYTKLSADHVEGTATIAKAVWADGYTLENISTPFSYLSANQELWFSDVNATLAGGSLRGNYRSRLEGDHTRFLCKVSVDRVSLDPLVVQGGGEVGQASGEMRGKFEMRGDTDRLDKAEGEGTLELRNARFRQFELFQALGRVFNIREFADFYISEGQAAFRVSGEKLTLDQINLHAPSLEIAAKGTVRLDKNEKKERKLALEARLSIDKSVVTRLPFDVSKSFTTDDQGRLAIDFKVSGTTDKPKTDLDEKFQAQTINSQLNSFLGVILDDKKEADMARKREEERKKREEEERKKAEKKDKDKKKKDKDKEKDKTPAPSEEAAKTEVKPPAPATPPNP
jgi:type II secretion system protein N